jgi:drug/metabolite transporter (DMT)-like permease
LIKKGLENIGNGFINLANMLLVLFFLNHWFLNNIEPSFGSIAIMLYVFTVLYTGGYYLSNKSISETKDSNE